MTNNYSDFYTDRITEHGPAPQGVGWNSIEAQEIRFRQLIEDIPANNFSINDLGCGYGSLYHYLRAHSFSSFEYFGYDNHPKMILEAKNNIGRHENVSLIDGGIDELKMADYCIASGVFNVKGEHKHIAWLDYVFSSIEKIFSSSRKSCSINFLTSYSDQNRMENILFYPKPEELFSFAKSLSRWVNIRHDYGIYDFTLHIKKDDYFLEKS